jgi:hypothetical protein
MKNEMQIDECVEMRKRATNLAGTYVKLIPRCRDIPPHQSFGEDNITVYPNPIIVYYEYEPKGGCPLYVRRWAEGRREYVKEGDDTIAQHRVTQYMALSRLAAFIMQRWGYDAYVQDLLQF